MIYEKGKDPLIISLDGVSDVRNFGAIVRTAECLGADAIMIPEKGSARITADAVKTSAGALHSFPVCREKSIVRSVEYLKESGLKVVCATEKTGTPDFRSRSYRSCCSDPWIRRKRYKQGVALLADSQVRIPMSGTIGSLNVSVSAGILIYEIIRQRSTGVSPLLNNTPYPFIQQMLVCCK